MYFTLLKPIYSIFIIIVLCYASISGLSDASQDDIGTIESMDARHIKCMQAVSETTIDMLIATRNVIAKNQELINRDPATGNYYIKGFVPAVAGSQVANDFSLMTGHRLKQTSLKVRNPSNAPDKWEKKMLKFLGTGRYSRGKGIGEIVNENGKKIYRYMKPIYVEVACLQCHGNKEEVIPEIRQFLDKKYPLDEAFGYKEGDLRGGISLIISFKNPDTKK
ncbi:MAG: DUF3365 domain-containing protein [Candidatus Scalindua rubra]|uniref:Methyl-accepting chemotaxis protein n=1 Tax=Candidatus Scalindua brodae TaxID=237368 RepID=A0A0B0ELY5_9BACT|nr:MAG: Methyl-accepting chemotaxis protein [Candidatus Scalindua brodae]MBZ0107603.1 DUF3365 domain-containing protein [Candidatus Scalindua rubra]